MDMAIVTPVFHERRLIAFCGSIAHKTRPRRRRPRDRAYGNARELFQEGIQYPPVRYVERGEVVRDLEAIVRANSRTPNSSSATFAVRVGVARLGERRIAETIARYGVDAVLDTFEHEAERDRAAHPRRDRDLARRRVRSAKPSLDARRLPTGRFRFHVRVDKRATVCTSISRESDDQVARAGEHPAAAGARLRLLRADRDDRREASEQRGRRTRRRDDVPPRLDRSTRIFPRRATPTCRRASPLPKRRLAALSGFVPERRWPATAESAGRRSAGRATTGRRSSSTSSSARPYGGRVGSDGPSGIDGPALQLPHGADRGPRERVPDARPALRTDPRLAAARATSAGVWHRGASRDPHRRACSGAAR